MVLLWKACCTWKVATALMSCVPKCSISSYSEGESPHSFIHFWLRHGVHYNSFLIFSSIAWGHPVSSTDRALPSASTQITICCPHFRYTQSNVSALYCFFRSCGPLLEMLLYQRLVSFHFLCFHSSPYQLGSSRLANSRIFNLGICSIYCFGILPSHSSSDTFTGSEVSAALNPVSYVSPTQFRAEQTLECLGFAG